MGLLNNASYVIMLASAEDVSDGGAALVYIANILPGLVVKASAPYWFDKVGYDKRIRTAAILMAFAFSTVAFFSNSSNHGDGRDEDGVGDQHQQQHWHFNLSAAASITATILML